VTGRSSLGERERVVRRLQAARVDDRISHDTFVRRLDLAFTARTQDELDWLLADLSQPTWATRAVGAVSRWTAQLGAAWRDPRTPRLLLPLRGEHMTLGRSRRCDCMLRDATVSRLHATLRNVDGAWWLRDEGSTNGTWINGRRVAGTVEVQPGDELLLGHARLVLA
jgi:hypothetical protein